MDPSQVTEATQRIHSDFRAREGCYARAFPGAHKMLQFTGEPSGWRGCVCTTKQFPFRKLKPAEKMLRGQLGKEMPVNFSDWW